MTQKQRTGFKLPSPGPYVARITSHLDPTLMGGVEAVLEKTTVNNPSIQNHVFQLQYLSPFYGVANYAFQGPDATNYYDVAKSYGWWAVPPDVGTKVLCIFVDSDSTQGYWFGCIQERFLNHMVPGIAASSAVAWGPGQKDQYKTNFVPVAEIHTGGTDEKSFNPNTIKKPLHPFAARLSSQGLLKDCYRGITSSSARREFPSQVYGISTPGPLDPASPKKKIGYTNDPNNPNPGYESPTSRLPGHTFVMDDGDKEGRNQLIRIRSGTGHQILLNDSANILYIANAEGSVWMEFTASGNLDIYAGASVNIHAQSDFNLKADGDFNIEAGGSFNVKTNMQTVFNVGTDFNLYAKTEIKLFADTNIEAFSKADFKTTSGGKIELLGSQQTNITSNQISLVGGKVLSSPMKVPSSGPQASAASAAIGATKRLPAVNGDSSIRRIPMHEPWNGHESRCDTSTGEHTVGPGPTTPSGPGNTPGADSNNPNNPTVLTFSADVWFEFDKAELLAEGKTALTTFADNIKTQNQQNTIVIEGHTDSVGTQTYNLALSQRRADAAKTFLVSLGIPAASIVAIGKGSSQPVAPNAVNGKDNPEGRSQNRRVNIVITGPYVVPSGSNEYLRFTVRTGDESHFEKCTTPMKNAVRAAGKAYYERTGRKITINSAFRSTEEEQAIYDAWVNAGGSASRPTVSTPGFGNLTTPVNPKAGGISPHSKGIAIDCQEAVDLDSLGILAKCGLKRPYSWDPLHINLS